MDRNAFVNVALDLCGIHIRSVFGIGSDSMVFLDKRIEDFSEIFVRIPVTGIDTTMLVVELHSAGNSLGKGESRGLCLV